MANLSAIDSVSQSSSLAPPVDNVSIGAYSSREKPVRKSLMRSFVDSEEEFLWPPEVGMVRQGRCFFHSDIQSIPLKWKRKIFINTQTSIDEYTTEAQTWPYKFKKPFIVKETRANGAGQAREKFAAEIAAMKGLRHPHIAALLGAFEYIEQLYIMIYPVARCDLDQFMRCMSLDVADGKCSTGRMKKIIARSDTVDSDTPDISTRPAVSCDLHFVSGTKTVGPPIDEKSPYWPLDIPLEDKKMLIRRYFVCLCQALSYLHESEVRHKDIKPGNILIDESGNVILTDFGISRRFPKHASHVTRGSERHYTREFASPEAIQLPDVERDDSSDVFSLGCVFLEMATLLLGRDLESLRSYCSFPLNDNGIQWAYCLNLQKVYSWCQLLKESVQVQKTANRLSPKMSAFPSHVDTIDTEYIANCVTTISEMMDKEPSKRPKSRYSPNPLDPKLPDLWQKFRDLSPEQCEDCDPRHPSAWKPSEKQREEVESIRSKRRSLGSIDNSPSRGPRRMTSSDASLHSVNSQETSSIRRPLTPTGKSPHSLADTNLVSKQLSAVNRNSVQFLDVADAPAKAAALSMAGRSQLHSDSSSFRETDVHVVKSNVTEEIRSSQENSIRILPAPSVLNSPTDETKVLAWDIAKSKPYLVPYGAIANQEPRPYPMPFLAQKFQFTVLLKNGESLILDIDLHKLSRRDRLRRVYHRIKQIYVYNL